LGVGCEKSLYVVKITTGFGGKPKEGQGHDGEGVESQSWSGKKGSGGAVGKLKKRAEIQKGKGIGGLARKTVKGKGTYLRQRRIDWTTGKRKRETGSGAGRPETGAQAPEKWGGNLASHTIEK